MITYIKGAISYKSPTYIVVEAGGIGYHVNISLHTYGQIEKLEQVQILTYLHIKEDSHTLYGFAEETERKLFKHLISVSGVGTATAQVLLSAMTPDEARAAIIGEDVNAFKRVKGIGPKTAKSLQNAGVNNLSGLIVMADDALEAAAQKAGTGGRPKSENWKKQAKDIMAGKPPQAKSDRAAWERAKKKLA